MKTVTIEYPEAMLAALNLSPEAFAEEARLAMAVKLFELGRLTSRQAAVLAGIPRVAFLLTTQRYGAASVKWDDAELEAEFSGKRQ